MTNMKPHVFERLVNEAAELGISAQGYTAERGSAERLKAKVDEARQRQSAMGGTPTARVHVEPRVSVSMSPEVAHFARSGLDKLAGAYLMRRMHWGELNINEQDALETLRLTILRELAERG